MAESRSLANQLVEELRAAGLDLRLVAGFTVTVPGTVQGWLSGKHPPTGAHINRLWHLLEAVNGPTREVNELEYYVGQLLAYRVIDLAQAMRIGHVKQSQAVLNAARGDSKFLKPTKTLTALQTEYGDRLKKAQAKLREKLGDRAYNPGDEPATTATVPVATAAAAANATPGAPDLMAIAIQLGEAFGKAAPLLREVMSGRYTPAQRAQVRELVGPKVVFDMVLLTEGLNSERLHDGQRARGQRPTDN
ncbi:MAG TPA: hypothetical protein VLF91_05295 [Candidatus Saccharimonadales bacterium]|nr:hypothetical protein [Candidatus Saccharimonadales bacterium]